MDSDFWTARLAAAKRQFNLQHQHHLGHGNATSNQTSQLDRYNMDDLEVEEETRPDFPCPYCYEEFDIASLCSHLEDEHSSCESNPTVCPVCSVKVSRDMLSHITLQHGHLLKLRRRRRLRRFAVPSGQALSLLGRDLREAHLQALLGGTGYRSSSATTSNVATDPLLSSLVLNYSTSDADDITKSLILSMEDSSKSKASEHMWKSSFDASLSHEERQERMRQASGRAIFVQDLLFSSLLTEQ